METSVPATNQTSSTFLSLCTICQKPFTQEYSFSRHVSYCRRAKAKRKNRPKACLRCHISKTKCSLARPQCSRCHAQGLDCIYDKPLLRPLMEGASVINGQQLNRQSTSRLPRNESLAIETSQNNATATFNELFSSVVCAIQGVDTNHIGDPQLTSFATSPTTWQPDFQYSPSTTNQNGLLHSSILTALEHIHQGNLSSNFAVDQLTHAIYAFPQMMMRRQTFPPFIHAHWHMPELPESLANCMSVAQIFATRTPETRPFLWRMVGVELQRFQGETETSSVYNVQHSLQAIIQFIIMAVTDQDTIAMSWAPKLIETFDILCARTRTLLGGNCFTYSEGSIPDATWEEWIFAETRRRIICLWFFMSRIISPTAGSSFMRAYPLSMLPLVSNKSLWEARSREEWETEKALHDASYPMTTFEELVEAKRRSNELFYRRRLQTWDAGVDKMGMLINIATDLI